MLSIAGQWSRVCCLVVATELLRGCWVSSCTGGRGQTSDTCTGTSSLSTEHSLDNVWYLHDEPGHAQPRVQALVAVQLLAAPPRRASSLEISSHCSSALCFVFNCLKEALTVFCFPPSLLRSVSSESVSEYESLASSRLAVEVATARVDQCRGQRKRTLCTPG